MYGEGFGRETEVLRREGRLTGKLLSSRRKRLREEDWIDCYGAELAKLEG